MPAEQNAMEAITDFVRATLPRIPADTIDSRTPLIANGLDSLAVLELITFLSETFGVEIEDGDFDVENFETVGNLVALVERKRAA
ncbi:MAG TPA: phosphopantetheine-binding protein [Methylomirabilota bacterium]|nr:phosphopantetheine-binding protein [Methylomirabilota bacterium]